MEFDLSKLKDDKEPNNPGRPSRSVQIQIENKLRQYFQKAISAKMAASEIGINIKTACNYYKKWQAYCTFCIKFF